MKKILLVCNAGMSTSLLVSKMQKVAEEKGIEATIEAISVSAVKDNIGKYDVCLVGPQIRFNLEMIKSALNIPTEVIDMKVYGLANGEAALEHALGLIE